MHHLDNLLNLIFFTQTIVKKHLKELDSFQESLLIEFKPSHYRGRDELFYPLGDEIDYILYRVLFLVLLVLESFFLILLVVVVLVAGG